MNTGKGMPAFDELKNSQFSSALGELKTPHFSSAFGEENGMSISWRGPAGSGKRYALHNYLNEWCKSIGQTFIIKKQLWDAPLQGGESNDSTKDEDAEEQKVAESGLLPMEVSILHWGFDVSRMSLQDKQYIKSILLKWGRGGQVLTKGKRCLVFYHAHLLSSESILLLQAFLEENHQDTLLWLTSEHPLPSRLADWCLEIPVASPGGPEGKDLALEKLFSEHVKLKSFVNKVTVEEEIRSIYLHWMKTPPKLSDVKQIRSIVYALLHRNIRWVDGFHQWMFVLETIPLTQAQKILASQICIRQPFTGSGQTVPSYRIPILWENYLCSLRNALSPP